MVRTTDRFAEQIADSGLEPLAARGVTTLQVNLGKLCNQACRHCHVDAGPHQTAAEVNMAAAVVADVHKVLREGGVATLDLTGGAPELNPHFRELVRAARELGIHVMDRCNLSVLLEPGQEDLGQFLADHQVEIVASLPFYSQERTDRQRGAGVFERSVTALRLLNALGYGDPRTALRLNLVYNPVGAYLPGDQQQLEADFKRALQRGFGVRFDRLFCITNMPIARFAEWLERSGNAEGYRQRLLDAFNAAAVDNVMCRDLVSIGPDGTIYDCDFNQMLGLPVADSVPGNIRDFDATALARRPIVTGDHCLGCTAGAGSSCGGAVT
jgi:radical SAM/Cys-rich protein